jgi:hypothetical protein
MLNRWIGIAAGFFMLLANAAILYRDVLPDWLAGDPPPSEARLLQPGERHEVQVGIYDAAGRALGTSWTVSSRIGEAGIIGVKTTTLLGPLVLPGGITTPRVRIETTVTYSGTTGSVDTLEFKMHGLGVPILLQCEAMASGEFPCSWQVGTERGSIGLDSRVPAALGDVIRPFQRLPDLYVGRSWRLDLLDPLARILPQLKQTTLALEPVVIRVTAQQTIEHQGSMVEVFVVEGGDAIAWVAPDGRVLRQEVRLPLLGRLVLLDEPYDDHARAAAARATGSRFEYDGNAPAGENNQE